VALDRGDALGGVRGIYLPEHRGARRYFHVWVPASAQPLRGHFVLFEWATDVLLWLT